MDVKLKLRTIILLISFSLLATIANSFYEGDFIPTSRKGQFASHRTHWHDLLGQHCPRFAQDRLVAVPIPKPIGFSPNDEFKIQLSFDGERFITPWLPVLGGRAPFPPYIDVQLTRSGDGISAVSALSAALSDEDVQRHRSLVDDFLNTTHWPKNLLVYYHWQTAHQIDTDRGLLMLFAAGAAVTAIIAIGVMSSYRQKLAAFLADVTDDGLDVSGGGGGGTDGPSSSYSSMGVGAATVAGPSSYYTNYTSTTSMYGGAKAD